jgi:malate dehydrogenase (oxaloacetate-decarboxylating)(NADP+)
VLFCITVTIMACRAACGTQPTDRFPRHRRGAPGVQFPDVTLNGRTFHPGQANNFCIYPAVGLAIYATHPKRITDEVLIAAAQASADQVTDAQRATGMPFPSQADILGVEISTAIRVAEFIFDQGLATVEWPADIPALIEKQVYRPYY